MFFYLRLKVWKLISKAWPYPTKWRGVLGTPKVMLNFVKPHPTFPSHTNVTIVWIMYVNKLNSTYHNMKCFSRNNFLKVVCQHKKKIGEWQNWWIKVEPFFGEKLIFWVILHHFYNFCQAFINPTKNNWQGIGNLKDCLESRHWWKRLEVYLEVHVPDSVHVHTSCKPGIPVLG